MKILVLDVCGLHLGYLGCYGSDWVATPTLDGLAAEGVVFDQHYADCLGVSRSPWTGRYQFPAASEDAVRSTLDENLLDSNLQKQGVAVRFVPPATGPAAEGTVLERTLEAVLQTLDELADEDHWLVWADLPALLPPWDVPEEFYDRYCALEPEDDADEGGPQAPLLDPSIGPIDVEDLPLRERLQSTYAAAVTYFDTGLRLLLEELRRRPLWQELLLIVTSERGLALGEHGIVGDHRPWLHDELIHLPLICRLPGGAEAGRRIFALTQPVDLLPTLLSAQGLPVPEVHGQDLLPLIQGRAEQVREYACAGLRLGGAVEWALRTPTWGLVLPLAWPPEERERTPQLYVKPDDRWEVNDVRQHHLELVEQLSETLRGFVEATRRPGPLQVPALG